MAAILNSAILVFPLKLTHTCQDWFPPFSQKKTSLTLPSPPFAKKNFTHSFWLNLMMAAILNSTMLDSDTLFFSLRFTQKHSHSTLTLTQTNLIWLKLIHSHNLMMVAILNFAILNSTILDSPSAMLDSDTLFSSLRFTQKHSLHSDSDSN